MLTASTEMQSGVCLPMLKYAASTSDRFPMQSDCAGLPDKRDRWFACNVGRDGCEARQEKKSNKLV